MNKTDFTRRSIEKILTDNININKTLIIVPNIKDIKKIKNINNDLNVTTLDELVSKDKIIVPVTKLILILYRLYKRHVNNVELYSFWPLGKLLINDFDTIERSLANAKIIFTNTKELKTFDCQFSDLPKDQQKVITSFWNLFSKNSTKIQSSFLEFWRIVQNVYNEFKQYLLESNQWYLGLCYNDFCKNIQLFKLSYENIAIIGFNAFYKSDLTITKWLIRNKNTKIFWDADEYYLSNPLQESGKMFRQYKKDVLMSNTFSNAYPNSIINRDPVKICKCTTDTEQINIVISELQNIDSKDRDIGIILCDDSLFSRLITVIPQHIQFESTFLYPTEVSCVQQLFNLIIDSYTQNCKNTCTNYFVDKIQNENLKNQLLKLLNNNNCDVKDYFTNICAFIAGNNLLQFNDCALLKNILDVVSSIDELNISTSDFKKTINVISKDFGIEIHNNSNIHIVKLEDTTNMSFDITIIVGANDSVVQNVSDNSIIPYSIKRGYGLPTNDTFFRYVKAYHFYRLLHSSNEIIITYNATKGEYFRYIQQLKYELPNILNFVHDTNNNTDPILSKCDINVKHVRSIKEQYANRNQNECKIITPNMINTYLECQFKFYCRYVLDLKKISDKKKPIGTMIHNVLKSLYEPYIGKIVNSNDIASIKKTLEHSIKDEFNKIYGKDNNGEILVEQYTIRSIVDKFLDQEMNNTPFKIIALEKHFELHDGLKIKCNDDIYVLGGRIDRIDIKDNIIRVIDYKSGNVQNKVHSVDDLFDSSNQNRNKEVFQILLYTLLLNNIYESYEIKPYLVQIKHFNDQYNDIFIDNNAFSSSETNVLNKINNNICILLDKIFNSTWNSPSKCTSNKCQYCEYQNICKYS